MKYPPQTRIEGEIQQLDPSHPVTELWQVISSQIAGRIQSRQITQFDSVEFSIDNFSTLRYVQGQVQGTPFIQYLDLLADPDDPRNLFGMLKRSQPNASALEII